MIAQLLLYLRFRHRLIALNRRLGNRPWPADLLAVRALARLPRLARLGISAPFVLLLAAARLRDAAALAVLAVLVAYLAAECVNAVLVRRGLASIRLAMDSASKDMDRALDLGAVRDRGIRNGPFLQAMFAEYEPLRAELEERFPGLAVRNLDDAQDLVAGAWVMPIPGRFTDIVVEAADAEVLTERDTDHLERRLPAYARSAHARGRFLTQLRRARLRSVGEYVEGASPPVDDQVLEQKAEAGLNYVVRRLRWDPGAGTMRVEVDRAIYGQIMRSCDYLIEEAFIAAGLCAATATPRPLPLRGTWLMRTLPGRRSLMRLGIDELIAEPRHRAVGVGLAGVVFHREPLEGEAVIYYKRRSDLVGTYPDMYHAVPTGMFNSKTRHTPPNHDERMHAGRVLLTEFVEECKNGTDLEGFDEDPHWVEKLKVHVGWMLRDPESYNDRTIPPPAGTATSAQRLAALQMAEATQCAERPYDDRRLQVYATGLALDLLSLRPEICCAIELEWGLLSKIDLNEEGVGDVLTVPSDLVRSMADLPRSGEWVRSGYAAVRIAHEAIERGLDPAAACGPVDFGLVPDFHA
ncbi:MAG: hypothetical protein QOE45_647 [Frankiaceae bacterium]|nr:hypothetical protein [Frankiaceae bacterium]